MGKKPNRIYDSTRHLPVVYYLTDPDRHAVKIGTTVNMTVRLQQHQRRIPGVKLEYIAWEYGGEELEHLRHRQFSHIGINGEWFFPAPELREHIMALRDDDATPTPDPLYPEET